jgi:hypothetical protein
VVSVTDSYLLQHHTDILRVILLVVYSFVGPKDYTYDDLTTPQVDSPPRGSVWCCNETRGKGTFIIEKMEDHFLALQTYVYHDNAVPSEVLLTTFCSFLYLFEVVFNLVNGTGTFFMAAVLFILQKMC